MAVVSEIMDFGGFKSSRVSISMALIFAAAVFSGLPGAGVVGSVTGVADAVVHPRQLRKTVFNLAALMLTGATFYGVLEAFSFAYSDGDYVALIGPAMVAGVVAFVANSSLVSAAIALDNRISAGEVWSENFRWMAPHYVFMGVLAVLVAVSYDRWEIGGLALSVVPMVTLWFVMKQNADTARESASVQSSTAA
jgi:hypothetical protein